MTMSFVESPVMRPLRAAMAATILVCVAGAHSPVAAQELRDNRPAESPLVLKARGSFFVGGEQVEKTSIEIGSLGPADQITVNQMYVEYMVPDGAIKVPVVMVHGATLTGKTYDTTPDGRMGWYEYFVRNGHPSYVVDQVGRGRSGFDSSVFNNARAQKISPDEQPALLRLGDRFGAWTNFRIGPEPEHSFPDTKFPVEAADEFSKQGVPDLLGTSRAANPNWKALSTLARQLDGAVLLTHSQSGPYPLESAIIDARGIRAIVMVEPGTCNATVHADEEIAILAKTPILILFGDYLSSDTRLPGPSWKDRFDDCEVFKRRVDAAGGDVRLLTTVEAGVRGNSHMLMMDRNNLQIADLILSWIDAKVGSGNS